MKTFATILILCLLPLTVAAAVGEVTSADGVMIRYETQGAGAPALVFVHGWSCDRSYWRHQTSEFSDTRQVVALDLAGHGESGTDREAWTIPAFAEDVAAVVRDLGLEDVVLIGHSMGGPVVVEAALLLGDVVRGVVPVDALHDVTVQLTDEQKAGFLAGMIADFPVAVDGFVRSMFPAGADSDLVDLVAADMSSAPPEVALAAIRGLLAFDVRPALAGLAVPVRCLNADLWPTNLAADRSVYADFDVVLVKGVGHFLFLEAPETFDGKLAEVLRGLE